MNLTNLARTVLSTVPGLNTAIDGICDRANLVFRAEHHDNGRHAAITADSLDVAGDVLVTDGEIDITSESDDTDRVDLSIENTHADGQTRLRLLDDGGGYAELALFNSGSAVDSSPQAPYMVRFQHASTAAGLFVIQNTWNNGIALYVGSGEMFKVDNAAAYERGRSVGIGVYAAIAFNAGNFVGDASTWTLASGDQVSFTQRRIGTSCQVNCSFQTTSVGAGNAQLRVTVPTAVVASGRFTARCSRAIDAGVATDARVVIDASVSTTALLFLKVDGTNWTATAANDTLVEAQIEYESAS